MGFVVVLVVVLVAAVFVAARTKLAVDREIKALCIVGRQCVLVHVSFRFGHTPAACEVRLKCRRDVDVTESEIAGMTSGLFRG
jgi:hypothetical protein